MVKRASSQDGAALVNRFEATDTIALTPAAADFVALLKPRVMSLVVFTAFVGLVLAPGALHPAMAFAALVFIAIGAGASGAINMWYDADIDAVMKRTRNRPIPAGRVSAGEALGFGVTLAIASVVAMGLFLNMVAAALLALTIGFYVFVYTMWLKRRTPQNIVIGGAAGAFPPMIGWAAVTGEVTLDSIILFAIIFMWTPPHFWALSLYRDGDYAKAGVPMLPVVAGRPTTRRHILAYTLFLLPVTLLPTWLGTTGWIYGGVAVVLGLVFLGLVVRVLHVGEDDSKPAKFLFAFSILYLFLLFAVMAAEHVIFGG